MLTYEATLKTAIQNLIESLGTGNEVQLTNAQINALITAAEREIERIKQNPDLNASNDYCPL